MADFNKAHDIVDNVADSTNFIIDILLNNLNSDSSIDTIIEHSMKDLSSQLNSPYINSSMRGTIYNLLDTLYSALYRLTDSQLLKKFKYIESEIDIEVPNLKHVIQATDELVYDVKKAKAWITSYNKHLKLRYKLRFKSSVDLEALGKAILGRAIELCPIDTGFLRKSGTVVVFRDHVDILFLAPYATKVHEDLNVGHRYGDAKFLELAVQELLPSSFVWIQLLDGGGIKVSIDRDIKIN